MTKLRQVEVLSSQGKSAIEVAAKPQPYVVAR
jgi:hypothetical protein